MRLAVLLLLAGACLCAQDAGIEGLAVNTATGEPLSGVHIRLIAVAMPAITAAYGAISDPKGRFSIAGMPAGAYILAPERAGFLYVPPKSESLIPNITLKAGQHLTDYKLEMTPRAVIAGRVVDEYGDPVPNVNVQASMVPPDTPPLNLFGMQNYRTDDRGEFRMIVAPGKYFVKASPFERGNQRPEIRTDGTSDAAHVPTFYPSAATEDRASPVSAAAGADVTGIEIRLAQQARSRGLTLSGVVIGTPDGLTRATVTMQYGDSAQKIAGSHTSAVGPDGKFQFAQQQPGYYRLTASYSAGKTELHSQIAEGRLDAGGQGNVQLVLAPGADVTGTLEVTGGTAEKRTIRLGPAEPNDFRMGRPLEGETDEKGAFRIANLPPGRYRVAVEPLPDNAYIQAVLLDGAAAPDGVLDLSRGASGSRIQVTVNPNGGQLSGRVTDKDGQPLVTPLAVVVLAMDGKEADLSNPPQVSVESTYTLHGIRPGKYHLFALDAFHYVGRLGPQGTSEAAMKELVARGEAIEIKEGDRITKDVKVLEKEDANAGPKQ